MQIRTATMYLASMKYVVDGDNGCSASLHYTPDNLVDRTPVRNRKHCFLLYHRESGETIRHSEDYDTPLEAYQAALEAIRTA